MNQLNSRQFKNFGRNVSFSPDHFYKPSTVEVLLGILSNHRDCKIRAVGSMHSWSEITSTSDVLLDLSLFDSVEVKEADHRVVVGAGCKVKRVLNILRDYGLTLPSVGLIDEQTVAGATATGTHGSGKHSLSHYIRSVTLVHFDTETGEPTVRTVDSGAELLAARCSLGMLGIIVSLTLECRPQYNVEEHARAHATLDSVLALESQFPLQQFYLMPWSWEFYAHHRRESNLPRSRTAGLYRLYCFGVIDLGLHLAVFSLTKLLRIRPAIAVFYRWILPWTIVRNWKVIDDSYKLLVMEHELFRHIEIEIFVLRKDLESAIGLIIDILKVFAGRIDEVSEASKTKLEETGHWQKLNHECGAYFHHYPICVRRVLQDNTLISMASPPTKHTSDGAQSRAEDWYAISFISYEWPNKRSGFYKFADFAGNCFAKIFGARCHWGKYNPLSGQANRRIYPQLEEFQNVASTLDANSNFINPRLENAVLNRKPC